MRLQNMLDGVALDDVAATLWRERDLLESLAFKLDVERLLAAAGERRWRDRAADEVDALLAEIRRTEVLRAVQCHDAARRLGATGETLREIAAAAAEPWRTILTEHHVALRAASADVTTADRRQGRRHLLEEPS